MPIAPISSRPLEYTHVWLNRSDLLRFPCAALMVLAALAFERCATLMVCWLRWTGLTRAWVVWLGWCTAWSLARFALINVIVIVCIG
eukprot:COSAG02_NODE_1138_length_14297_cov_4.388537_15_plen_87_part_00